MSRCSKREKKKKKKKKKKKEDSLEWEMQERVKQGEDIRFDKKRADRRFLIKEFP